MPVIPRLNLDEKPGEFALLIFEKCLKFTMLKQYNTFYNFPSSATISNNSL